jgi:hypothetical protein
MIYLPPFALFGARTAVEQRRLDQHIAEWVRLLEALRDDRVNLGVAQRQPRLNVNLAAILRQGE